MEAAIAAGAGTGIDWEAEEEFLTPAASTTPGKAAVLRRATAAATTIQRKLKSRAKGVGKGKGTQSVAPAISTVFSSEELRASGNLRHDRDIPEGRVEALSSPKRSNRPAADPASASASSQGAQQQG